MASAVFILGAGASKQAGAPLMSDFLDVADHLYRSGRVPDEREHFARVFEGIAELTRVHSKSQLDISNMEAVFAAFEMARTLRRLGAYPLDQIDDLLASMRVLIVRTLEETLTIQGPTQGAGASAPEPYGDFVELIRFMRDKAVPPESVAILTFNYDIATEFALALHSLRADYALADTESDGAPVTLLKLHGSLNWVRCKGTCGSLVSWDVLDFARATMPRGPRPGTGLTIGSQIKHHSHCGVVTDGEPVIVPPTWNKGNYQAELSSVWSRAAHELSAATNIFAIGYSLPESDHFFRYLYALGTAGNTPLRRLWVFDPDRAVENRYRALLGPGALQRFRYFDKTFNRAIEIIRSAFDRESGRTDLW